MSETLRLETRGITKTYGHLHALNNASFDLKVGEIHALLGHNGAGKSTLVKILSGVVLPDAGSVMIDGEQVSPRNPRHAQDLGVALVDQELSLVPVLTVEENLRLGSRRAVSSADLRSLLDTLGLEQVKLTTLTASLPIGEQQLVEIARALSRDAKIIILDEPTATLSEPEIERVFAAVRRLAAQGKSVIYVSHRLGEVLNLCQRATVFRDGQVVGTKNIADLDRAGIVEMMLGHLPEFHRGAEERTPAKPERISISGLAVPPRVAAFDLDVKGGVIVGLAGQVGCGASEVLRALAGLIPNARGSVELSGVPLPLGSPVKTRESGIFFAPSDRKDEGLFLTHSIESNLVATRLSRISRAGFVVRSMQNTVATALLNLTGIARDRRDLDVGVLSGGNQQKVLVARGIDQPKSKMLLFDEPARGVDVAGRADIHELIRRAAESGNVIIFHSTDLDEVFDLSDLIVTMFAGRIVSVRSRAEATPAAVLTDMTHGIEEISA